MTDLVLQTKLQPPQIKGKILRRQRLINLLNENLDKKLILICADAGYGKTTLLAQFCAELDRPYLFYDLDTSDNDIATFFNYLVAGIQQCYSGFGQRTKSVIPQTRNIEIIVGTFINEFVENSFHREICEKMSLRGSETTEAISPVYKKHGIATPAYQQARNDKKEGDARNGKDFYIILDDYHHLQQNKEISNALDYLLRHLPHNLHLIISSRSTPPLNLAYYLAKQDLFKLEKAQLQFNIKEIQALLKDVHNLKIPDSEIERINQHSEGWITAIQLILQKISATGEDKTKETLNGYIASGEEIFNYFAREVFDVHPKEIQEFLMKTSILDFLNPEICDYLLKIKKSRRTLHYLEAEHIFISKHNDNLQYHPLFREFLFKILKSFYTGLKIRLLYRRAGSYSSEIKDYVNAVNYFLLSEDYEKAARMLEKSYPMIITTGQFNLFISLLERLPLSILDKHPCLLLAEGKIFSFLGRWSESLKILGRAKRNLSQQKNRRTIIETLNQIGYNYLVLMQPTKALRIAKKAYKLVKGREKILLMKTLVLFGNIHRALGKYGQAENFLKKAERLNQRIDAEEIIPEILKGLARVYSEKTDFKSAIEIYSILITKYKETTKPPLWFASCCANAASLYLEVYDFEKAEELLKLAEKFAQIFNDQRTVVYLTGIWGKLYLAQGDYRKAIGYFKKAIELNSLLKEKLVDLYARTDIVYAYLALKEISQAKLEFTGLSNHLPSPMPPPILIDFLLLKGKIAIMEKDYKSAEDDFLKALAVAGKSKLPYQKMAILYYLAKFYFDADNKQSAEIYLKKCFAIAEEKGYDFFLIKQAREDLKAFQYALENDINKPYLLKIIENLSFPDAQELRKRVFLEEKKYHLEIELFGNLIIKDKDGKVLESRWKTKKTKSLFIYLVLNQGKRVLKDTLIEIFWPDKGLKEAIRCLHDQISFVRKVLKNIVDNELTSKDLIIYQEQFYTLGLDLRLRVDVLLFEELIKNAKAIESVDKPKAIESYKKALDLYKADFCPELYEEWAEEKRRYYRSEALMIAKKLAEYYYANKDYQVSINFFRRAILFDRCDEAVHVGIMRCLYGLRDKAGVIQQYRELEKILKEDLDTQPSIETQRIYQKLLEKSVQS